MESIFRPSLSLCGKNFASICPAARGHDHARGYLESDVVRCTLRRRTRAAPRRFLHSRPRSNRHRQRDRGSHVVRIAFGGGRREGHRADTPRNGNGIHRSGLRILFGGRGTPCGLVLSHIRRRGRRKHTRQSRRSALHTYPLPHGMPRTDRWRGSRRGPKALPARGAQLHRGTGLQTVLRLL